MERKMKNLNYLLIVLSLMAGFVSTQTVHAKSTEQGELTRA
jgi:hypothetical protein